MSVFQDWGKSFSRPFQQFVGSWKRLLTDPKKMNLGDAATVLLPGVGALTVNAVKNPWDVAYQAGTFAMVYGGAAAAGISGAVAPGAVTGSTPTGFSGLVLPESSSLLGGTMSASLSGGGTALTSAAAPAAAAPAGAGFFATLGGAGKAVGSFVVKAAAVSAAAREIVSPWQRAAETLRDAVSGQGSPGQAINASSGGGLPGEPAGSPAPESMSSALVIGVAVSVVGGILWASFRGKK